MEDSHALADINKYKKYLDNFNLTDDQKTDIVMIISSICSHFIDESFNGPSDKTFTDRYNEFKKNLPQTPERIRTKNKRKIKEIDG
jgi:hypothetical protein